METRSIITAKQNDGSYKSIYCHNDGYLSYNGRILLLHYDTQAKIDQLLSHGDMSSLKERCDKPEGHSYETPVKGCSIYYGRDRGEEGTEARVFFEPEQAQKEEYNYLWDGEKWLVSSYFSNDCYVDLKESIANKADEEE